MKIALIGPMASGKSTLGPLLAAQLALSFFDTDVWIEQETGLLITKIFTQHGEAFFRTAETHALTHILSQDDYVLATGGGSVVNACNRILLAEKATIIIYLDLSIEGQLERIQNDTSRPLLMGNHQETILRKLRQERDPLYRTLAHITIPVDKKNPDDLVQIMINTLAQCTV